MTFIEWMLLVNQIILVLGLGGIRFDLIQIANAITKTKR